MAKGRWYKLLRASPSFGCNLKLLLGFLHGNAKEPGANISENKNAGVCEHMEKHFSPLPPPSMSQKFSGNRVVFLSIAQNSSEIHVYVHGIQFERHFGTPDSSVCRVARFTFPLAILDSRPPPALSYFIRPQWLSHEFGISKTAAPMRC